MSLWEEFRESFVRDLNPFGVLETDVADRAAILSWRLKRVVAYETGAITATSEENARLARGELTTEELVLHFQRGNSNMPQTVSGIETQIAEARSRAKELPLLLATIRTFNKGKKNDRFDALAAVNLLLEFKSPLNNSLDADTLEDEDFFSDLAVPDELKEEPETWDGWTVGRVQKGIQILAKEFKTTATKLVNQETKRLVKEEATIHLEIERLGWQLAQMEATQAKEVTIARQLALLPTTEVMERVTKYESHLQRQLIQTLQLLERLQEKRTGRMSRPVSVDVIVTS